MSDIHDSIVGEIDERIRTLQSGAPATGEEGGGARTQSEVER